MPTYRATIDIDAPSEKVWEAIGDFGNIHKWNPSVPTSHLTSDQAVGEGTTRHCDLTVPGASIEERITDWQEGRSYSVEIYQKKRVPFVKNLRATVSVEPNGVGSKGGFKFEYDTIAGPIGRLMDRFLIASQNRKAAELFVSGLKHYVETGEEVAKGVRVDRSSAEVVRV